MRSLSATLIMIGVAAVAAGVLVNAGARIGLGHLPGDLRWGRGSFRFYAPVTTSLLVSAAITVILNLMLRR
jgi:hypothetical protein